MAASTSKQRASSSFAKHGVFPTLPIGRADRYKPREGARLAYHARSVLRTRVSGRRYFETRVPYKEIIDCASSQPIAIEWNPFVFDN